MYATKKAFKTWEKLAGADHFLRMMKNDRNYNPFIFNLDAFLGQFRAITLAMQKELHCSPGFDVWYVKQRCWMEKDPQMKLLLEYRNLAYHQGIAQRRLGVSHHETIRLDVKTSAYVYDLDGNITEKQLETPYAPETGEEQSIKLEWYFADPEVKEKLERLFPDDPDGVESLFKIDIIDICDKCFNDLQSAITDFLFKQPVNGPPS